MVPKVAGKGTSFKGAALYYLHDKQAETSDRILFTFTENLPTDNPDLAIRQMAYTAMHQAEIKASNDNIVSTGRKLQNSVYTYSLSWAPDETPTQAEMIEAARETLKVLGLKDHEALMVAHDDEPHPHVHVIVNRVHPETGLAAKLSKDHLKLSRWAEKYEKEQGKIRCDQRVENNKKRKKGEFVKDKKSINDADFFRWRKDRLKQAFDRRQKEDKNLSATHKGQQQFLYDEKEMRVTYRMGQIKEQNRHQWKDLYRQQWEELRERRDAQKSAFSSFKYWLKHRDKTDGNFFTGAIKAILGQPGLKKLQDKKHENQRKALSAAVAKQQREARAQENKAYRAELDKIKELQKKETQSLKKAHTKESQDLTREIKKGTDREKYQKETPERLKEEFRKRAAKAIRKAKKKREERGKGHGRERD